MKKRHSTISRRINRESIGYQRHDPVEMAGEYSIRGGILDVFPPGQDEPVRIEFFGDEIQSIRRFDPTRASDPLTSSPNAYCSR